MTAVFGFDPHGEPAVVQAEVEFVPGRDGGGGGERPAVRSGGDRVAPAEHRERGQGVEPGGRLSEVAAGGLEPGRERGPKPSFEPEEPGAVPVGELAAAGEAKLGLHQVGPSEVEPAVERGAEAAGGAEPRPDAAEAGGRPAPVEPRRGGIEPESEGAKPGDDGGPGLDLDPIEALALPVEAAERRGQPAVQPAKITVGGDEPASKRPVNPGQDPVKREDQVAPARDRDLGGGGGGGGPVVRDVVHQGDVGLVANPGDDRHRAVCDRPGERLVEERGEVLEAPAAPDEQDHRAAVALEPAQRPNEQCGGGRPLNRGGGEHEVDPGVPANCGPEHVAQRGAVPRRRNPNQAGHGRDPPLSTPVGEPFGPEALDPLGDGEAQDPLSHRDEALDDELKPPPRLVDPDPALEPNHQTFGGRRTERPQDRRGQEHRDRGVLVGDVEVAVAGALAHGQPPHLALHRHPTKPVRVPAQRRRQLAGGQRSLRGRLVPLARKRERQLGHRIEVRAKRVVAKGLGTERRGLYGRGMGRIAIPTWVIVVASLLLAASKSEAQVYKYTNEKGVVVFTDKLSDLPPERRAHYNEREMAAKKRREQLARSRTPEQQRTAELEEERRKILESRVEEQQREARLAAIEQALRDIEETSKARAETKAYWQERKATAQRELQEALDRYREAVKEYEGLAIKVGFTLFPGQQNRLLELQALLPKLEADVDRANAFLTEALPEEARRAGVPPGWLR